MGLFSKLFGEYAGSHYPSGIVNLTADDNGGASPQQCSYPQCTPGKRDPITGAFTHGRNNRSNDADEAIGRLRIEDAGRSVGAGWSAFDGMNADAAEYDAKFTHATQVEQPQRVEVEQPISVPNWPARVGKR